MNMEMRQKVQLILSLNSQRTSYLKTDLIIRMITPQDHISSRHKELYGRNLSIYVFAAYYVLLRMLLLLHLVITYFGISF